MQLAAGLDGYEFLWAFDGNFFTFNRRWIKEEVSVPIRHKKIRSIHWSSVGHIVQITTAILAVCSDACGNLEKLT